MFIYYNGGYQWTSYIDIFEPPFSISINTSLAFLRLEVDFYAFWTMARVPLKHFLFVA
jgi:hypothetical protein